MKIIADELFNLALDSMRSGEGGCEIMHHMYNDNCYEKEERRDCNVCKENFSKKLLEKEQERNPSAFEQIKKGLLEAIEYEENQKKDDWSGTDYTGNPNNVEMVDMNDVPKTPDPPPTPIKAQTIIERFGLRVKDND